MGLTKNKNSERQQRQCSNIFFSFDAISDAKPDTGRTFARFPVFFYRIVIHPPLGFLFHPSVSSHADELIRGRIMQIMMVIFLTIITIDRGERKKKTKEEYKAGIG